VRRKAGPTAIGYVLVSSAIVLWLALLGASGQRSDERSGNASEFSRNMPGALFPAVSGDSRFRSLETTGGDTVDDHSGDLQSMPPWVGSRVAAFRALPSQRCPLLRSFSVLSVAPKTSPPAAHPVG
jgi:hypothetical protein